LRINTSLVQDAVESKAEKLKNQSARSAQLDFHSFLWMSVPTVAVPVDFNQEIAKIKLFLESFCIDDELYYQPMLKQLSQRLQSHLEVDMDHVAQTDADLAANIESNTKRYANLFYRVVDDMMPDSDSPPEDTCSPLEVLLYHRAARDRAEEQVSSYPAALLRRYTLSFKPRDKLPEISVRQIKASTVGKMVKVRGMVTRVSNVKPLAVVAAYHCDKCGSEVFQDVFWLTRSRRKHGLL
jgi:DNA replication licensing factor MCM7